MFLSSCSNGKVERPSSSSWSNSKSRSRSSHIVSSETGPALGSGKAVASYSFSGLSVLEASFKSPDTKILSTKAMDNFMDLGMGDPWGYITPAI